MKVEVRKLLPGEFEKLKISDWGIWRCGASKFPWKYAERETCYILEGEVEVTSSTGETVRFGPKDLVIFPEGLECTWNVIKPVKKHYNFG
ncbi:TPA: cupin [bacterium]|nr:MAG: cupin [Candidatus Hydrogenedentes bacterium CG1_02_42_14]PIU48229.1 MAG: cupin [Candidatus Hydrogenedentes bacterium CG07_land_8_20_14_0_80_42_17]HBW47380.1 cupin [bacterium]